MTIKRYKPVNHGDYYPPTMQEDKFGEHVEAKEMLERLEDIENFVDPKGRGYLMLRKLLEELSDD